MHSRIASHQNCNRETNAPLRMILRQQPCFLKLKQLEESSTVSLAQLEASFTAMRNSKRVIVSMALGSQQTLRQMHSRER